MGTILPLPNVGATPRNYRQIYSGKSVDAGFNDVETLEAFWPSARDVTAEVVSPTRKVLTYLAPTVSRGTRRQRADVLVDARSCAKPNSKTWLLAEHVAQSTGIVDDNSTTFSDGVLAVAAGEYTSIALFENLPRADGGEPRRVRKRLRVAVFEAPVLEKALYPAAVYDYSFLLRR